MAQNKDSFNNTHINKNMMLSIVTLATKEVAGVVDIIQPPMQKWKKVLGSMNFLPNTSIGDGVSIVSTQLGLVIDVFIVAEIGYSASDVVYRVQQNIKNSISIMIEMPIKAINVHIEDAVKHPQV